MHGRDGKLDLTEVLLVSRRRREIQAPDGSELSHCATYAEILRRNDMIRGTRTTRHCAMQKSLRQMMISRLPGNEEQVVSGAVRFASYVLRTIVREAMVSHQVRAFGLKRPLCLLISRPILKFCSAHTGLKLFPRLDGKGRENSGAQLRHACAGAPATNDASC